MSLAKEGYKAAINGTAIMKAERDASGYIITNAETTPAGSKTLKITKANAENSASDNEYLFATLLGFTNSIYLGSTNQFTVSWAV